MKRKSSNKNTTSKKKDSVFRNIDKTLLFATLGLLVFGLIMIMSASSVAAVREYGESEYFFVARQIVWAIFGLLATLVILKLDTKWYNLIAFLAFWGTMIVLVITMIHGETTNGSTSWLTIGPIRFQPSEFAKTAIIMQLACILGGRKKWDGPWSIILKFALPLVMFLLVFMQPDLGTALIILTIILFIFFSLPVEKNKIFIISKLVVALGIIIGIPTVMWMIRSNNPITEALLTKEQQERIAVFTNPCGRYEDSGYQVCHGYIAINTGGITGAGLGNSTQKFLYLPEAYTDFIFPIITEELGIIGAGLVLVVYIILLTRVLIIARNASNLRGSIIAFGTFGYIIAHIVVNLGGVLALMPLTGVPLPFLSYGGSFLINLMILLALTQKVAIDSKIARKKLEMKKVVG